MCRWSISIRPSTTPSTPASSRYLSTMDVSSMNTSMQTSDRARSPESIQAGTRPTTDHIFRCVTVTAMKVFAAPAPALACRRVTAPETTTLSLLLGAHLRSRGSSDRLVVAVATTGSAPLLSGTSLASAGGVPVSDSQPCARRDRPAHGRASTQRIAHRRGVRANGQPFPGGADVDRIVFSHFLSHRRGSVRRSSPPSRCLFRSCRCR